MVVIGNLAPAQEARAEGRQFRGHRSAHMVVPAVSFDALSRCLFGCETRLRQYNTLRGGR